MCKTAIQLYECHITKFVSHPLLLTLSTALLWLTILMNYRCTCIDDLHGVILEEALAFRKYIYAELFTGPDRMDGCRAMGSRVFAKIE